MKTHDLIDLLAQAAPPAPPRPIAPRLLGVALAGAAVSALILIAWLGLRPMHQAMHSPPFWMKAAYTAVLALAGLMATARLARPGGRIGAALVLAAVAVAWLSMMAMMETMRTPAAGQAHLWLGWTWAICPFRILALAAPVFAALFWLMRRMAPTRPALAGAAAGLFAGGVGATVYGLYCQETAAAFVV
ncbi:MAG TPA: DUF1109 domain-containing protein, partial [Caulobacteraceae bacterium]|nr:DUF1109 domain-containing protein [Caulobacteraceae bacterium]